MLSPSLLLLAALPRAAAGDISALYVPPPLTATNNLSLALHGTGTNGFIYNSSTSPPGTVYNYCNMPHVAPASYVAADATRYELRYVELIHRHHKRTPYASNVFPAEDAGWSCAGAALWGYAGGGVAHVETHIAAPVQNPLHAPGYHPTDCAFPQLTAGGLADAHAHAQDLRAVYADRLRFLPADDPAAAAAFRVTNNIITSQVAGAVAAGLFPRLAGARVPALQQPPATDSLEPAFACAPADSLRAAATGGNASWAAHLAGSAALAARLDAVSGVAPDDAGWHASWDHYFDDLTSRRCHGMALPCNATTGTCVSAADADAVARLGQWEYAFYYRDGGPAALQYSAWKFGIWLTELVGHFADVAGAAARPAVRWRHNVAHDGSVSALLGALQVAQMVWPGMGAEVVFELYWDRRDEQWVLRVLWGGRVLQSNAAALGDMDMVPLHTFTDYVQQLVGEGAQDVVTGCGYA